MKKIIVALGLAACIMTLGACSEESSSEEIPKSFTQAESEKEALKTVKAMFNHLDKKDEEKLEGDFYLPDDTFLATDSVDYVKSYDVKEFIKEFGDNKYSSNVELSIIPKDEWSQKFKKEKKKVQKNYKVIVLAKYTGKSLGNYSLIIPLEYDEYDEKYKVWLTQDFTDSHVQTLLSEDAYRKYAEETFPLEVKNNFSNDNNSDNYFSESVIRTLLIVLHREHSDVVGNYAISIHRTDTNKFLIATDKGEMMIEFKDLANMNYNFDWQITRNGSGEVLLQSDTWE